MRSISSRIIYAMLVSFFSITGCNFETFCQDYLRVDGVSVLDSNGEFVDHLEMTVRNVNTDKIITPDFWRISNEKYIFVTSHEVSSMVKHNDVLEITLSDADHSQKAKFLIKANECHVTDVIGPETITWNSN